MPALLWKRHSSLLWCSCLVSFSAQTGGACVWGIHHAVMELQELCLGAFGASDLYQVLVSSDEFCLGNHKVSLQVHPDHTTLTEKEVTQHFQASLEHPQILYPLRSLEPIPMNMNGPLYAICVCFSNAVGLWYPLICYSLI